MEVVEHARAHRSILGMLKHRRPDLYASITAPREDLYDFWYFEHGRDEGADESS